MAGLKNRLLLDRRKISTMKKVIFFIVFMVGIFFIGVLMVEGTKPVFWNQKTPVYQVASTYEEKKAIEVPRRYGLYSERSPEQLFLKGLQAFDEEDYGNAKTIFSQIEEQMGKANDKALPFYVAFYQNQLQVMEEGSGNTAYIEKMLQAITAYPYLANDHCHVWPALHSIAKDETTDGYVIAALEDILEKYPRLSTDAVARYNNCIAMLDFFDGNYGKSIRRFYDVNMLLEERGINTNFSWGQKLFANSYIGVFYYEFDEYEAATQIFRDNIALEVPDPIINAERKYSDYINLSSTYLDLGKPKEAKEVCEEMGPIIPYIRDSLQDSVRSAVYDNLARAAILEGDLKEALSNIEKAEKSLAAMKEDAFYGSDQFIKLTKAKYANAAKDYAKAQNILEEMKVSQDAIYAGLEEEINTLLLELYKELGEEELYQQILQDVQKQEEEKTAIMKQEYLEFSQYYAASEMLKKENQLLESQRRFSYFLIAVMVFILLLAVGFGIFMRWNTFMDPLTKIQNRKALHVYAKKHQQKGIPMNTHLIMLDIDFFKKYNDVYGHLEGDEALKQVAAIIRKSVRKKDFCIRYGGEEFLVILENITQIQAETVCQRILRNMEAAAIPHTASEVAQVVTLSLGLCANEVEGTALQTLLTKADHALYEAKDAGRNTFHVISYRGEEEKPANP